MFGIGFIIIGILVLLQTFGVFGAISPGIIWGIAFIVIGLMMASRRSMRRNRRQEWMAKRHDKQKGQDEQ
jgi:hypothetical protein